MRSRSTSNRNSARAFTFIEVLVTMAIFSFLFALALFSSMEAFRGSIYHSEVSTIVSLLERARSRAMNNIDQATWGVCYLDQNYAIIKASSVCDSASAVETVGANPAVAAASGFATPGKFPVVVFAQLTGDTTAATIAVTEDSRTATISLNNEGTISW